MLSSGTTETFIADQRKLLSRLEAFIQTDAYFSLKTVVSGGSTGLTEVWLAEWLITPAYGLDTIPLNIADEPDGIARLLAYLERIVHGVLP